MLYKNFKKLHTLWSITLKQRRLNLGWNDAFCVIGNVGVKMKDADKGYVLRPVDASKCVCGAQLGELTALLLQIP